MYFYAKSTGGFYHEEIHGDNMPADAVEITDEYWRSLLTDQENGKVITADAKGYPIAIEAVVSPRDKLVYQILLLDGQITTRMRNEAAADSANINPKTGNTAKGDIQKILAQQDDLRAQMAKLKS